MNEGVVQTAALLADLLERQGPALVLYARQRCRLAEDVVQEAFCRLAQQSPWPKSPVAWLYRVVRNLALDAQRSERRRSRHESAARVDDWFETDLALPIDAVSATDALTTLPTELREIIVAHLWGGLTFEQVGELHGLSTATAHRRYVEGLQQLRVQLESPCREKR